MLCNNFEVQYFYFSHRRKTNVPSSLQVRKTNVNKRLFLALSKDFSAVSAGGSEFIAASLDRQFHDSANFSDLSAGICTFQKFSQFSFFIIFSFDF